MNAPALMAHPGEPDALERKLHDIGFLYEMVSSVGTTLDVDRELDNFLDRLARGLSLDGASVYLLDGPEPPDGLARRRLTVGGAAGIEEPDVFPAKLLDELAGAPETPIFMHERPGEAPVAPPRIPPGGARPATVVVALHRRGRLYGALAAVRADGRPFCPGEARMLVQLAGRAALAIDHAQLYQSLERRVAERTRELEAANVRLAELARLKSEFLDMASHELRTPLTVLGGYLGMLFDDRFELSEAEHAEMKPRIHAAFDRLSSIVSDLLEATRLESGAIPFQIEAISLWDLLGDVSDIVADRHGIRPHLPPEADLLVSADYDFLERIVLNLVDNACKYREGPDPPSVRVVEPDRPGFLRLAVANRGPALSDDEGARLFGRFSRLPRHARVAGTGLGLYCARLVAEQMGGAMGHWSAGGEVVFWLELPSG